MKKKSFLFGQVTISFITVIVLVIITILALFCGCASAPYTGRHQLILVSQDEEAALGIKAYKEVLSQNKISTDAKVNAMVQRVGMRIAAVTNRPEYKWEFTVIDGPNSANAFALPGGKVAVYTGILPYTHNEAGLAFVLAHEIGHAISRHGGERMSEQLLIQFGQGGLNMAIAKKSASAIQAINLGYGLLTTVGVVLPFSRTQEYEADHIGIILSAKAGYDPREAPHFFERMMKGEQNKATPPEFLSTHPADQERIQKLIKLIPEAMNYYQVHN
ncbi:MAG: M48 family metallopeptidase [Oligoflexia bacterium]|nr:M48 family metallopeptidase [Oligoflexia bacterium]